MKCLMYIYTFTGDIQNLFWALTMPTATTQVLPSKATTILILNQYGKALSFGCSGSCWASQ